MYANKSVGAVIPAYNEEEFIGEVIDTLPAFIDRAYVIDDASTDRTWEAIQQQTRIAQTDGGQSVGSPRENTPVSTVTGAVVVPIRHETNQGVGGAIKTGYRRARRDEIDVTVVIAGDGQTAPDVIERIVRPVAHGEVDYAKGNRMLTREGMPAFRQFGNYVLGVLTKIASGYWKVSDPQNGSTAISLDALRTIDLHQLYEDYGFANDLLVRLNVHDMRVADVPRRAVYRNETSDIRYSSFIISGSWLLLRSFLWRLNTKYLHRNFHPLAFFYFFGAGTVFVSTVFALRGLWVHGIGGASTGAFGFAMGWLFIFFAMVFDYQQNEHLQQVGPTATKGE